MLANHELQDVSVEHSLRASSTFRARHDLPADSRSYGGQTREQGIEDEAVLGLMGSVPRHIFIDEAWSHRAYEDSSLPIGHGQTISQPFIVALMSQLLNVTPRQRVLEVGTGSGYQTAVLASLCQRLYSVERIQALVPRAKKRLEAMKLRSGFTLVMVTRMGGERAFDGILVTAAPPQIPAACRISLP